MEPEDDEEPPLAIAINDVVELELPPHLPLEQRANQRPDLTEAQQVGVTVITGYLGAGKSTVRKIITIWSNNFQLICVYSYSTA